MSTSKPSPYAENSASKTTGKMEGTVTINGSSTPFVANYVYMDTQSGLRFFGNQDDAANPDLYRVIQVQLKSDDVPNGVYPIGPTSDVIQSVVFIDTNGTTVYMRSGELTFNTNPAEEMISGGLNGKSTDLGRTTEVSVGYEMTGIN